MIATSAERAPHGPNRDRTDELGARIAIVTGIDARLARRAVAHGIASLEDLELAAYDGRLEAIPGFGARRVEQVRRRLDRHLGHRRRDAPLFPRPSVACLLAIDADYRDRVAERSLPLVVPRRFNREGHAWLPVWHTQRDRWTFTVMFSNTPRAYALGKRLDWVIVVYERDGDDDHCTVVTEHRGPLAGLRVVRGRERECRDHYRGQGVSPEVRAWVHAEAERLGRG